jgi:hypothetical protein
MERRLRWLWRPPPSDHLAANEITTMRLVRKRLIVFGLSLLCAGCALHATPGRPKVDRNLLTKDQFVDQGFTTAYDVVQALRSNWLETKGPDSFTAPSKVLVYLDGVRVGGVETLSGIELRPILYIRHFDGIAATARWGLDHGSGVIYVSTHPLTSAVGLSPDR